MIAPAKTRLTFADYDALPETNQIIELIDGEVVVNPPFDKHQQALGEIYFSLRSLLKVGRVRMAPTGLHFDDGNSFEPDLFWVSPDNAACVLEANERYWHGAPDLVVEILSPSTEANDRGKKFQTYQRYGVREYWLVNPEARFVEVYRHDGQAFKQQGIFNSDQPFVSAVLGDVTIHPQSWFAEPN